MTQALRETSSIEVGCDRAFAGVIGSSPAWQGVLVAALRVATTEATVLLQGESGTGKEIVARLIHQASPRKHGPFVAINCAALPEQLLESELFGYERGAFTGAQLSKAGLIELAARGVLFLDEVSEMSLTLLAEQFLADCARTMHRRIPGLRDDGLDALLAHDWPGNVRELRNVLERAAILSDGDIESRHLSLRPKMRALSPPSDLSAVERGTIERVLHETGWNKSRAARRLGLTRTQLYGRLRRYDLEADSADVA
jgi:transcriptional regulator with PAS, ATPase and Fis domain